MTYWVIQDFGLNGKVKWVEGEGAWTFNKVDRFMYYSFQEAKNSRDRHEAGHIVKVTTKEARYIVYDKTKTYEYNNKEQAQQAIRNNAWAIARIV